MCEVTLVRSAIWAATLCLCVMGQLSADEKVSGIAAAYPGDKDIDRHPSVVFCEDFEHEGIEVLSHRWETVRDAADQAGVTGGLVTQRQRAQGELRGRPDEIEIDLRVERLQPRRGQGYRLDLFVDDILHLFDLFRRHGSRMGEIEAQALGGYVGTLLGHMIA